VNSFWNIFSVLDIYSTRSKKNKKDKMNIPYEKMPTNESKYKQRKEIQDVLFSIQLVSSSSDILIDGPIHNQQAPTRIRHYFVFSLISALCLCPATGKK